MKPFPLLSWRSKCNAPLLLDETGGGKEALQDGGMGGGTKAGTTPAFDTPTVCSDKKSIKLTKK